MRITGGEWCGRTLRVPPGDKVRPTQDRVRAAIFSMLATLFPGASVLDLYAGSGSFGLDALSRGASHVTWVEQDRAILSLLKTNVTNCLPNDATHQAEVCCSDALKWLNVLGIGRNYDIVFCDPPYRIITPDFFASIAETLTRNQVIAPGGIFIGESASRTESTPPTGWESLRDRTYGHTRIILWRPCSTHEN